jgi:hypothetical protein
MRTAPFGYHSLSTLAEEHRLVRSRDSNVCLLAGGQGMIDFVKLRGSRVRNPRLAAQALVAKAHRNP